MSAGPVAWLKEWDSVGGAQTGMRRVDLTPDCEQWLKNMFPEITPLYAVPPADTVDAACWRYFLENHRQQIAAAFNCPEYEIIDRLRDCVPEARPAWMKP